LEWAKEIIGVGENMNWMLNGMKWMIVEKKISIKIRME
jgi:hypothetical protein